VVTNVPDPAPRLDDTVLSCRAGFEPECAQEIEALARAAGVEGAAETRRGAAHVIHRSAEPGGASRLARALRFADLVFARQWFAALPQLQGLPDRDRVTPVVAAARGLGAVFSRVEVETADAGDDEDLVNFCRRFSAPLVSALRREGLLVADASRPRLHAFFVAYDACRVGLSDPSNSSPWPMGIPRLRFPRGAPSRSALKLEEAWHVLVPPQERASALAPGLRAVDLGAAPGGWSFVLAARGLRVTAVDNGPLAPAVLATGLVEHLRVDGFRYRPRAPVDWVLCDMVEQPSRVADLMAAWIADGHATRAIFNLKLPMKKRWQELQRCLAIVEDRLAASATRFELRAKQLYHDREEVTAYLARLDPAADRRGPRPTTRRRRSAGARPGGAAR
jgi:23S rRNA (cytidine2498-2'-O)-methyltransferase